MSFAVRRDRLGPRSGRWFWGAVAAALSGLFCAQASPPSNHNQVLSGRYFHAPVADDECTVCHTIHRDPVGPNLQAPVPQLCYQCHENVAAKDVVHEPVGKGRCSDCHRVHTSEHRQLLLKGIPDLCIECHPVDASHVGRNTLCTSCHGVHSSETARFLKGERTRNCGSCHKDKREGHSLHPPSQEGKCLTCHFTHPDPRFTTVRLRAAYPSTPRAASGPGVYALCDPCHEPALYTDPKNKATGFRTTSKNLHLRHVGGAKGLTCSACHDVHGARTLLEWVRAPGQEPKAMNFLSFPEGGSCGPACHPAATYRREGNGKIGEK